MLFACAVGRVTACFQPRLDPTMVLPQLVTTRVAGPFVAVDEEIGMVDAAGVVPVHLWMTATHSDAEVVREKGGGINVTVTVSGTESA